MRRTLISVGIWAALASTWPALAQSPRFTTVSVSLGQKVAYWVVTACHPKTHELTLAKEGAGAVSIRLSEGDVVLAYGGAWTQRAKLEKIEGCTGIFELER